MKIYTKRGDDGETSLFGGERVAKDSARVEALGAVDELNAALGLAHAQGLDPSAGALVREIQSRLFDFGADLAMPGTPQPRITGDAVIALEAAIDTLDAELEPLRRFILPGGAPGAAALHFARSVCRRVERLLVAHQDALQLPPDALPFINRLSDLLFVMARAINARAGVEDPLWQS